MLYDDCIYLDGINIDKDFYICLGGMLVYLDIYIIKSLFLIGYGNLLFYIWCFKGISLIFNGFVFIEEMYVILIGFIFS